MAVLGVVSLLLVGLIGTRLWFLQVVDAEGLEERVEANRTRTVTLPPERGRIFDADGRLLADNERVLTITVDRDVIKRESVRTELFSRLSGPLQTPIEELERRFESPRYDPLQPLPLKEDVSEETVLFLRERTEDYPGVDVREDWRREYPYAPLASHVVGYLGAILEEELREYRAAGYSPNDRVGRFGVEKSFETELRGTPGTVVYEVDARGNILREVSRIDPVAGNDLWLTVDLDLQQFAEETLETQLRERRLATAKNPYDPETEEFAFPEFPEEVTYKAPAGSVVVLNHNTGQVLAMASYPTFDNRWFNAGISGAKFQQIFPETDDPDRSILVNRAIQGRYNLGSTFKPFVAYAALNTDLLPGGVEYRIDDQGSFTLAGNGVDPELCQLVKCIYKNAVCASTGEPCEYGRVNVTDALAVSSDVFFYSVGANIFNANSGAPVLQEEVMRFGFGRDSGIDLPYEFDGTVPDAAVKRQLAESGAISDEEGEGYYIGDNVQLAIGQGLLSATPLQLANGYAALANGGLLLRPHIAKAVLAPGTPDAPNAPGFADLLRAEVVDDFGDPEVLEWLDNSREQLTPIVNGLKRVITGRGVTSDFYHATTGEKLFKTYDYDGLPIAGKTGTAQGFQNQPWNDSSAFAGFSLDLGAPYTVAAYLEKSGYGSRAAAPVTKCIFSALQGDVPLHPVLLSDPLDPTSTVAAPERSMPDSSCLGGQDLTIRD
jgi:penicillin-binding protein 2